MATTWKWSEYDERILAFALLLTGTGMAWSLDFWDTQLLAQNMVAGIDSFPLLAVPFF